MTIKRLHFEEGYPLNLESEIFKQVNEAIFKKKHELKALPEGDYDLTPVWWTKHLHDHHLTVLSDGTAIYRLKPREEGVGTVEIGQGKFRPGGKVVHIPRDNSSALVGGPRKDLVTIGIYEIILFTPGLSPK